MITSEPPFNRDSRLTTQALHWDRGRPARYERRKVRGSRQALNFRCSVRAARSLRAGRPLRAPQSARISPSTQLQMFFSRCALTAGGSPATSTARCEDLAKHSTSDVLFALRAHCGRAARAPSEELEWSVSTDERDDYSLEYFGLEWRGNVFVAARGECPFTKLIRTVR